MDTVTEARLAICIAQEGGVGIIHKNMPIAEQGLQVRAVRSLKVALSKTPSRSRRITSIREVMALTRKQRISGLPVVEGESLVGIVTNRDLRFETRLDQPVANVMTPKDRLVTVNEGTRRDEVLRLLHHHRIEKYWSSTMPSGCED